MGKYKEEGGMRLEKLGNSREGGKTGMMGKEGETLTMEEEQEEENRDGGHAGRGRKEEVGRGMGMR